MFFSLNLAHYVLVVSFMATSREAFECGCDQFCNICRQVDGLNLSSFRLVIRLTLCSVPP